MLDKVTGLMPKSMNKLSTGITLQSNISAEIKIGDLCWTCGGTGKLSAMTMAMTFDAGTVRNKDVLVDCNICDGRGRK